MGNEGLHTETCSSEDCVVGYATAVRWKKCVRATDFGEAQGSVAVIRHQEAEESVGFLVEDVEVPVIPMDTNTPCLGDGPGASFKGITFVR